MKSISLRHCRDVALAFVFSASLLATTAHAGVILQDVGPFDVAIAAFQPVGQSFVAEDPSVSIAFSYTAMNPGVGYTTFPLRMDLYAGAGISGTPLRSQFFTLPNVVPAGAPETEVPLGFFDVNFSSVPLTVGSSYTAAVSTTDSINDRNLYWGVTNATADLYSGGRAFFSAPVAGLPASVDLRFRVTPVGTPPPPLSDFSTTFRNTSPFHGLVNGQIPYLKTFADFDVALSGGAFNIGFNIDLTGDSISDTLRDSWEQAIQDTWSDKFAIEDGTNSYPIRFDVRFVDGLDALLTADARVTVHDMQAVPPSISNGFTTDNWMRSDNWYTSLPDDGECANSGILGRGIAHEFGHLIGLYDEYPGGQLGPLGVQETGLMRCPTHEVERRYFEWLLGDLTNFTHHDLNLIPVPGYAPTSFGTGASFPTETHRFNDGASVDEPPLAFLLGAAFLALFFEQRRTRRTVWN